MDYFAGLDVSLRSCALCIVDAKGTICLERELPCDLGAIADCLRGFAGPVSRVGFEAGMMSQHLFFSVQGEGFDVVCMEARQVNAALPAMRNKMRNKTDRNDARGIAQVLRTGWFSPVHMKSRASHGMALRHACGALDHSEYHDVAFTRNAKALGRPECQGAFDKKLPTIAHIRDHPDDCGSRTIDSSPDFTPICPVIGSG